MRCVRCDRWEPCVTVLTRRSNSLIGTRATAGCSRPNRTPDGTRRTVASQIADRRRSKAGRFPRPTRGSRKCQIERAGDRVCERRRQIPNGETAGALGKIQPLAFAELIDRLVEDDQRQHIRFVERRLARQPHLRLARGAADIHDRRHAGNDALRVHLQSRIDRARSLEANLAVAQHLEAAPLEVVEAPHHGDGADQSGCPAGALRICSSPPTVMFMSPRPTREKLACMSRPRSRRSSGSRNRTSMVAAS